METSVLPAGAAVPMTEMAMLSYGKATTPSQKELKRLFPVSLRGRLKLVAWTCASMNFPDTQDWSRGFKNRGEKKGTKFQFSHEAAQVLLGATWPIGVCEAPPALLSCHVPCSSGSALKSAVEKRIQGLERLVESFLSTTTMQSPVRADRLQKLSRTYHKRPTRRRRDRRIITENRRRDRSIALMLRVQSGKTFNMLLH